MASVSDWLIEMEEDAGRLARSEWVAKHGASRVEIWERANGADNQGELKL